MSYHYYNAYAVLNNRLDIDMMPSGIPVATVAINGGKNAAHLALQIMATHNKELHDRLVEARVEMEKSAMKTNEEVIAKYSN